MGVRFLPPLVCVASVLLLTACSGSPKTAYYTLGGAGEQAAANAVVSGRIKSLSVGPVRLPSVLDRQEVVLRKDGFSVDVSESHLWGGELESEFLTALTERLQARLPHTRLQNIPWELEQTPQLQVSFVITRFDGMPGGTAELKGSWELQRPSTGKLVKSGLIDLQRPVEGKTVEAVVRAQSRLVSDLVEQVMGVLP